MANRQRGEVAVQAESGEYIFCFSINALCELEDAMGKSVQDLNLESGVDMRTARTLVWAALRDKHPETSLADAGNIASEIGLTKVMAAISEAFQLAFPQEPTTGKKSKGRVGTG